MVILGVAGSLLGSFVAGALGISGGAAAGSWMVATAGAAILIAILQRTGVFRRLAA